MAKDKPTEMSGVKKTYRPLPISSMNDIVLIGDLLSKTKIMGEINPAEGFIIAAICYQHDIAYDDFAETYNVMHGRLSKKADAILVDLKALGGSYQIIERTAAMAKAVFSYNGQSRESTVKFEDLKSEPFIYNGKESDVAKLINAGQSNKLIIKSKYSTDRSRMQMLWARCISDGVRVVCPAACKGIYTPEETSDFDEETGAPCVSLASLNPFNPPEVTTPSASPVEICPIGQFEGKKWEDLETDILVMVEDLNDPAITAEMKQHVRDILAARKGIN
jgi:hypothetical protein